MKNHFRKSECGHRLHGTGGVRFRGRRPLSCTHDPLTHVVRNWLPPTHEEEGTRNREPLQQLPTTWTPLLQSRALGSSLLQQGRPSSTLTFRTGGQENPAGARGSGSPGVSTQLATGAEFRYQPRGEAHRSPPTLNTNSSCQTCACEMTGMHLCLSGSTTEGLIFTWE